MFIVSKAYHELETLKPTIEEIQGYAQLCKDEYGVVSYSEFKGHGDYYFLRFHNTWKKKFGGRIHIDVGYVDENNEMTHLMLDRTHAPDFVEFIKKRRNVEDNLKASTCLES
jgi:hypothetical protein